MGTRLWKSLQTRDLLTRCHACMKSHVPGRLTIAQPSSTLHVQYRGEEGACLVMSVASRQWKCCEQGRGGRYLWCFISSILLCIFSDTIQSEWHSARFRPDKILRVLFILHSEKNSADKGKGIAVLADLSHDLLQVSKAIFFIKFSAT